MPNLTQTGIFTAERGNVDAKHYCFSIQHHVKKILGDKGLNFWQTYENPKDRNTELQVSNAIQSLVLSFTWPSFWVGPKTEVCVYGPDLCTQGTPTLKCTLLTKDQQGMLGWLSLVQDYINNDDVVPEYV